MSLNGFYSLPEHQTYPTFCQSFLRVAIILRIPFLCSICSTSARPEGEGKDSESRCVSLRRWLRKGTGFHMSSCEPLPKPTWWDQSASVEYTARPPQSWVAESIVRSPEREAHIYRSLHSSKESLSPKGALLRPSRTLIKVGLGCVLRGALLCSMSGHLHPRVLLRASRVEANVNM